ncbi:family F420-dependent oxidoreductase domain protein [Mycobacterium xenopi 4042]|uniref:Family F420-dependent oxidoreductase domain protein n=1 Tax=Mycobacterium xenopi 4042 TaxID=1299334 RepID=X8AI23_MYCXE|nr:family F420-dependent oxidoreductase domain protein [Mycobacterium xenopi 4042]
MRLGVMIGAERGDSARKVNKLLDDIEWAEAAAWTPHGFRRCPTTLTR